MTAAEIIHAQQSDARATGDRVTVEIKRLPNGEGLALPAYATPHAAAVDLSAAIDEPVTLRPLERRLIPTGFALALPPGYEAQIRARSGLSYKHGLALANGVGTIDADYRGEVMVSMINLSSEEATVTPGMRIAQMILARYEQIAWSEVDQLGETDRGSGGFGSTGVAAGS